MSLAAQSLSTHVTLKSSVANASRVPSLRDKRCDVWSLYRHCACCNIVNGSFDSV